ncbi:hypothetical protein HDU76_001520 [Blyttiomyces sp. JEL0837]|nr:hypothetical protein HDU76_001520 [Blyttiomyces sp. JEL0837]
MNPDEDMTTTTTTTTTQQHQQAYPKRPGPFDTLEIDPTTVLGRVGAKLHGYQPTPQERLSMQKATNYAMGWCVFGTGIGALSGSLWGTYRKWSFRGRWVLGTATGIFGFYAGCYVGASGAVKIMTDTPGSWIGQVIREAMNETEMVRRIPGWQPSEISTAPQRTSPLLKDSEDSSSSNAPSSKTFYPSDDIGRFSTLPQSSEPSLSTGFPSAKPKRTNQWGDPIED